MLAEDFIKLDPENNDVILQSINPSLGDQAYDPAVTTIMEADLPFYHGYSFLDISDSSVYPERRHYAIYNEIDGEHYVIDFTNDLIYGLNKKLPIMLDEDNLFDYIRFFFKHVSGQHGRFLIIENIDDIAWRENPPPNAREVISGMIEPLTLLETKVDGSYSVKAFMVFKTGLFKAEITVSADGQIDLSHEEMLIEDIPILDDVVGH